jgi:gliding motility-associated-like protein
MNFIKKIICFSIIFCLCLHLNAQYTINGDTKYLGEGCFQLTPDQGGKVGTVWYDEYIDLNQPFDIYAKMYFGVKDESGADGIAIVFQDVGNNTQGQLGEGLGYANFKPAIAIEFDTWQNDDPPFDHIGINKNGNVGHSNLADVVYLPVQANPNNANIEDGQFHDAQISWNPQTNTIKVYFDSFKRIETNFDIRSLFTKDKIWWGFTAATGGASNEQKVCGLIFNDHSNPEDSCFKKRIVNIPNVFTPNEDGKNDTYKVENISLEMFHLQIFNRWGQEVFQTNNPLKSWDGTYNHEPVEEGTYFYIIELKDFCNQSQHKLRGTIQLLR